MPFGFGFGSDLSFPLPPPIPFMNLPGVPGLGSGGDAQLPGLPPPTQMGQELSKRAGQHLYRSLVGGTSPLGAGVQGPSLPEGAGTMGGFLKDAGSVISGGAADSTLLKLAGLLFGF